MSSQNPSMGGNGGIGVMVKTENGVKLYQPTWSENAPEVAKTMENK
ncbi:hypothetical protein C2W64_01982 [Brevibacillus laterosporus]|nr:hypothetical protein [Brevibacillus laterosporus]RAP26307.1 hypothetical protein C2W64_01982 [Brevibacillus laterosporus]